MRTTLTIDDDVLAAARGLARHQCKSLGGVLSALARRALLQPQGQAAVVRNGILLLPLQPGVKRATLAQVKQLRDASPCPTTVSKRLSTPSF